MEQFELDNPFIRPVETYLRDLEIVEPTIMDSALYLSSMTGDTFGECLEYVKHAFSKEGIHALQDPKALILDKNRFGDREKKVVTFGKYLQRVKKQNLLLAPSLTVYLPEEVRQSTHAEYIAGNVLKRKITKGEQMKLEGENNPESFEKAAVKKGEQENYKGNNNSYSGGTVNAGTILYVKSIHSTLTSTCRAATSYANANNEKFLMGNRHYYSPEITKANFLSIANASDLDALERFMKEFNVYYPSADDLIDMMTYSTINYWHNPSFTEQIRKLCNGFTPIQRAAILYVGDLYHLYKHNKHLVRTFLFELARVGTPEQKVSKEEYDRYDGDMKLLTKFINFDIVRGRNDEKLMEENPEAFDTIYATGRNVSEVLNRYKSMIEALFMTVNVPSSIHAFPTAYRRAAVISDTDSTMFTMQYWVEEFYGKVTFSPEAKRLVFGLVFLVSEVVMHILALMSANMGVSKSKLRMLAMKNEYYFAVLSLTTRSKHYYASQDAVEGVMFETPRMEVKGVGLRDSKVPPRVNKAAKKLMGEIIETIKAEDKLQLKAILTKVGNIERDIYKSIVAGKAEFLTTGKCKQIDAYKTEDNATYAKHLFWKEVFEPSFGVIPDPPYSFVKISVTIDNKSRFNEWVETIEDKGLANRLKVWFMREEKTGITNFHVPAIVVENMGIPEVITRVADTRAVISNTMGAFYLMLESLNVFLSDKDNTRLISDYY